MTLLLGRPATAEGDAVVLRHEEHDACRIPPGRYYVGSQSEWSDAVERKVQD
jgi:hypothetical protein